MAVPYLDLAPITRVAGTVILPGSKSISNRTLLLSALAAGTTEIRGLLGSDDVHYMLEALKTLGVQWQQHGESDDYAVTGAGASFPVKQADLFVGNAGTAYRSLTAALAVSGGNYTLDGVARMHERPVSDLVEALRSLGADIRYLHNEGFPPLKFGPGSIGANSHVSVRGNVSSQYLTGLLMALPLTGKDCTVVIEGELISRPYVEMTLNLMARYGVKVEQDGWRSFHILRDSRYKSPGVIQVEGDASSASYFLAAGAIAADVALPVCVEGVGRASIQGDVRFAEILENMGATIGMGDNYISASKPASGRLRAIDADFNHIPDAAMTIAVAALFADGTSTLRNIASWRVKETDRLNAMATELRKVGAIVEEGTDYLRVTPPERLRPNAVIDTYDDHRMAMCFSLVALGGVPVRINDPECVAKTFPDYFNVLATISA